MGSQVGAGGRKTHQRVDVTRWWVVVVAKGEKPTNESERLVGGCYCRRGGCREATNEPDGSLVVDMGGQCSKAFPRCCTPNLNLAVIRSRYDEIVLKLENRTTEFFLTLLNSAEK